jgi:predicted nucleotidyltransferase
MMTDQNLELIIETLRSKFKCHTALLYGSRARGQAGPTSDYDVVGICKRGSKTRVAKKVNGVYWDLFVYPEKDLNKLSDQRLDWRNAKILFQKDNYGKLLIQRVQKLVKKPFKPEPQWEIAVTIAWAEKQLERIAEGDVHGLFRRAEIQNAAISHYFQIRKKRYWGPKAGLQWLEKNDPKGFNLFSKVYRSPANSNALKALVAYVYKV